MDTRPIGVFDSGLGGLTAVRQLRRVLPVRTSSTSVTRAACPTAAAGGTSLSSTRGRTSAFYCRRT